MEREEDIFMKNILIHGLGQSSKDWNTVKNELEIKTAAPDLFKLIKGRELSYSEVYQAFCQLCESYQDRLNLCGLSLGGLLALNYAIQHPANVNSLVLIGTPYEIPEKLLKFQNLIFKLMPKSAFKSVGCSKKDFIHLSNSMADLSFMKLAAELNCPSLILCGEKDKANLASAKRFYEVMNNCKLVIVENSGHEVNKDNPHKLTSVLQDFWTEDGRKLRF